MNLFNLDNPYHPFVPLKNGTSYVIRRENSALVPRVALSVSPKHDAMVSDAYAFEEVSNSIAGEFISPIVIEAMDDSLEPYASQGEKLLVETNCRAFDGDLLAYCVGAYYSARVISFAGGELSLLPINRHYSSKGFGDEEEINVIGVIKYNLTKGEVVSKSTGEGRDGSEA